MQSNTSICIYHNGNSKILEFYKEKFKHLTFMGNLSETTQFNPTGCLWEICFADATKENLTMTCKQGVGIIRHISDYKNDCDNLLSESCLFGYQDWLNYVVVKNLSFADEIICDESLIMPVLNEIAIITTGRTANTHFVEVLKSFDQCSFEYFKKIDERFLQAASAIFMWRLDQWECLTSIWISKQTDHWSHQLENQSKLQFNLPVEPIAWSWIETDWVNICTSVLDHAVFYQYVIRRPIQLITTEQAIKNYKSVQKKIDYNKKEIIKNYNKSQSKYLDSDIAKLLDLLYNKVQKHIPQWKEPIGTKLARGQITDPMLKTDYELYRRAVWRFSNRSYKKYLFEQKRDRHNHLDHVLSIVDGFNNKVPPEVMGSVHNLRIIDGQANRHKSYRSEITVSQLLERFNK